MAPLVPRVSSVTDPRPTAPGLPRRLLAPRARSLVVRASPRARELRHMQISMLDREAKIALVEAPAAPTITTDDARGALAS